MPHTKLSKLSLPEPLLAIPPPPRHEVMPRSLEALSSAMISADDEPVETEDLAVHFLMEATQSSHPPAPPCDDSAEDDCSLFDSDAPLEACLGEDYFDGAAGKGDVRGFERMWKEIIQRELAGDKPKPRVPTPR
jgi:hypothetical protein